MDFPKVLLPYGIVVSPLAVQLEGPGPDPWWVSPLWWALFPWAFMDFFSGSPVSSHVLIAPS